MSWRESKSPDSPILQKHDAICSILMRVPIFMCRKLAVIKEMTILRPWNLADTPVQNDVPGDIPKRQTSGKLRVRF